MLSDEYQLLKFVNNLDEASATAQQHQVSKYRTSNLRNQTKYSLQMQPLSKVFINVDMRFRLMFLTIIRR